MKEVDVSLRGSGFDPHIPLKNREKNRNIKCNIIKNEKKVKDLGACIS